MNTNLWFKRTLLINQCPMIAQLRLLNKRVFQSKASVSKRFTFPPKSNVFTV